MAVQPSPPPAYVPVAPPAPPAIVAATPTSPRVAPATRRKPSPAVVAAQRAEIEKATRRLLASLTHRPKWLNASPLPDRATGPNTTLLVLGGLLLLLVALSEAALLSVSTRLVRSSQA